MVNILICFQMFGDYKANSTFLIMKLSFLYLLSAKMTVLTMILAFLSGNRFVSKEIQLLGKPAFLAIEPEQQKHCMYITVSCLIEMLHSDVKQSKL